MWQAQYDPEDSHNRGAFLAANLARTKARLLERLIKRKEGEAAGSLTAQHQPGAANTTVAFKASDATCRDAEDLTIAQDEMPETHEQGALVILSHWHEQ